MQHRLLDTVPASLAAAVEHLDEDHEQIPGHVALAVLRDVQAGGVGARAQRLHVQPAVADLHAVSSQVQQSEGATPGG